MHTIVVDLGFGDAGKGTIVDWLCRTRPVATVVRFNGGAQAAHNVVTPDGRHHTFSQFGAGTFVPGVRTHLSRFMVVEPLALAAEANHLRGVGVADALERLSVAPDALVTTPFHRAANRARERARGVHSHGSCGVGVGETVRLALEHPDSCALRVKHLRHRRLLVPRLRAVRDALVDELGTGVVDGQPGVDAIADTFAAFAARVRIVDDVLLKTDLHRGGLVFEGAQGVLLDEWRGFHPHTTWSTTTFDNALELAAEIGLPEVVRVGVTRAYQTRHGAGPFVTEDRRLGAHLPEPHNGTDNWQGPFRVGHLDLVALRYAMEVAGGADGLAVTHLDRVDAVADLQVCTRYRLAEGTTTDRLVPGRLRDLDHQGRMTADLATAEAVLEAPADRWADVIAAATGVPVIVESHGPTADDKVGQLVAGQHDVVMAQVER